MTKFGGKYGTEVWNAVNECFDVMPLAAVIDGMVGMSSVISTTSIF